MYTSLNIDIETHKFTEIIKGGDKVIVLFSDDGTTITKETHSFTSVNGSNVKGFLELGMGIETITVETASGDWENRYELDYSSDTESADVNAPTEEEVTENASEELVSE